MERHPQHPHILKQHAGLVQQTFKATLIAVIYYIWKERNHRRNISSNLNVAALKFIIRSSVIEHYVMYLIC